MFIQSILVGARGEGLHTCGQVAWCDHHKMIREELGIDELEARLKREGRLDLAQAAFGFLPTRAALDLAGWPDTDIFAH